MEDEQGGFRGGHGGRVLALALWLMGVRVWGRGEEVGGGRWVRGGAWESFPGQMMFITSAHSLWTSRMQLIKACMYELTIIMGS